MKKILLGFIFLMALTKAYAGDMMMSSGDFLVFQGSTTALTITIYGIKTNSGTQTQVELYQGAMTTSTSTTYTSPASTTTLITQIDISNTSNSNATFSMWHVPNGGSSGSTNNILTNYPIGPYGAAEDKSGAWETLPISTTVYNSYWQTGNVGINTTNNVGIGSSNPGQTLDVQGTVRASNFVGNGSGLTNIFPSGSAGTVFYNSSANTPATTTSQLFISSSNDIGIGNASPNTALEVTGDISMSAGADHVISTLTPSTNTNGGNLYIESANGGSGGSVKNAGSIYIQAGNAYAPFSTSAANGNIYLIPGVSGGNSNTMGATYIEGGDANRLGPSTAEAGGQVYIFGGNGYSSGGSQPGGNVNIYGGSPAGTGSYGNVLLGYTGSTTSGNVGVGNSSPSKLFCVGSSCQFTVDGSGNINTSGGHVQTGSTINSFSGNVGIGSSNPGQALDVQGTVRALNFIGAGTGLTGTASSLSIGGNATTSTTATTATNLSSTTQCSVGQGATGISTAGAAQGCTTYLTGNQTITASGDATGSGTTSLPLTLATVNSNTGSFTNANLTVNGKGLITAASNGITPTNYWNYSSSGNIGISTTAAVGIGTTFIGGTGEGAFSVMNGNVGIGTWLPAQVLSVIGQTYHSGNVGIGSLAPGSSLDVQGTTRILGASSNLSIGSSNPGGVLDVESTLRPIILNGLNSTSDNVGIGSFSPGALLDVQGTVRSLFGGSMAPQVPYTTSNGNALSSFYACLANSNTQICRIQFDDDSELTCFLTSTCAYGPQHSSNLTPIALMTNLQNSGYPIYSTGIIPFITIVSTASLASWPVQVTSTGTIAQASLTGVGPQQATGALTGGGFVQMSTGATLTIPAGTAFNRLNIFCAETASTGSIAVTIGGTSVGTACAVTQGSNTPIMATFTNPGGTTSAAVVLTSTGTSYTAAYEEVYGTTNYGVTVDNYGTGGSNSYWLGGASTNMNLYNLASGVVGLKVAAIGVNDAAGSLASSTVTANIATWLAANPAGSKPSVLIWPSWVGTYTGSTNFPGIATAEQSFALSNGYDFMNANDNGLNNPAANYSGGYLNSDTTHPSDMGAAFNFTQFWQHFFGREAQGGLTLGTRLGGYTSGTLGLGNIQDTAASLIGAGCTVNGLTNCDLARLLIAPNNTFTSNAFISGVGIGTTMVNSGYANAGSLVITDNTTNGLWNDHNIPMDLAVDTNGLVWRPANRVFLSAAYTNATTSFTNVTGLSYPIQVNQHLHIRCDLMYNVSATTDGIITSWTGPSSPSLVGMSQQASTNTTTIQGQSIPSTSFGTQVPTTGVVTGVITTYFPATVVLDVTNGANAGTVQLEAKGVGTGTLTIAPGSECQAE